MKRGLVLEGGAMRGMFTVGVLDAMMENHVEVDGMIGVSAGAAFGCNFKSGQKGRALRYNIKYGRDSRYCGISSLLRTGDYYSAEFAYHVVPTELDIFDSASFCSNPMPFYLVCTDVSTGKPVYHEICNVDFEALEWIRASASMPLVSNVVRIGGYGLLDGGITDSIPLEWFQKKGYGRNVVVLTQPKGYRKKPMGFMWLFSLGLRKYPKVADALRRRHEMYNSQLDYIMGEERKGNIMIICPEDTLPIRRTEMNPQKMRIVHGMGYDIARAQMDAISQFLSSEM